MADFRSNSGDANLQDGIGEPRLRSSKSSTDPSPAEPKVTIHKSPPDSRPRPSNPRDTSQPDDLTRIRGIDRELALKLQRIGISHYDQIAEWTGTDVRSLSAALKLGQKIYRQAWIEQAARLVHRRQLAKPARTSSVIPSNARQAASPTPAAQRSIATLVATAAAAIRARTRMLPIDVETLHSSDAPVATTSETIESQPIATAEPEDLPTRIATALRKIRETVGIASVRFPETVEPSQSNPAADPPELSEPEPAATPLGPVAAETGSAQVIEPAPAFFVPHEASSEPDTPLAPEKQPETETSDLPDQTSIPAGALEPPLATLDIEPAAEIVSQAESPPPDELRLIEDLPQRVSDRLNELGVYYFSEIAAFDGGDVETLIGECALGNRITRECWIEQAALLAAGRTTKASSNRVNADVLHLVPYPPPPLQRDRKAFAALSLSPPKPIIDRKWAPEPPAKAAVPIAVPPPQPATPVAEPPAISPPAIPADEPLAFEQPEQAYAGHQDQHAPINVKNDLCPSGPETLQVIDFEREEAEVTITTRRRPEGDEEPALLIEPSREAPQLGHTFSVGPPTSDWPSDHEPQDDDDDPPSYLANVSEASVEIVAARPRKPLSANTSMPKVQPESPPLEAPRNSMETKTGAQGVEQVEQNAIDRFLKALRGH